VTSRNQRARPRGGQPERPARDANVLSQRQSSNKPLRSCEVHSRRSIDCGCRVCSSYKAMLGRSLWALTAIRGVA
jgi:hypothetical protein